MSLSPSPTLCRCWSPSWLSRSRNCLEDPSSLIAWVDRPCCRRAEPCILLFFNKDTKSTTAILTHKLEPLATYFQCRIEQGTATAKSTLCYDLKGFIRYNLTQLRRQKVFGTHLISVASGAMEDSDRVQQQQLEEEARNADLEKQSPNSFDRLEEVLEICRLHRLGDDLDVLSIYCMRLASKAFGRVAARMAKQRLCKARLILTPYVDGTQLSGTSSFARRTEEESDSTSLHQEYGRPVEYTKGEQIPIEADPHNCNRFRPVCNDAFRWNCEEMALAGLERWWGDIVASEYVGQKLELSWVVDHRDADHLKCPIRGGSDPNLHLSTLRLEASVPKGATTRSMSTLSEITLQVMDNVAGPPSSNDLSFVYNGAARVDHVDVSFLCLVRAYARRLEPIIRMKYRRIEEKRPILKRESSFLQEIVEASSLSSR